MSTHSIKDKIDYRPTLSIIELFMLAYIGQIKYIASKIEWEPSKKEFRRQADAVLQELNLLQVKNETTKFTDIMYLNMISKAISKSKQNFSKKNGLLEVLRLVDSGNMAFDIATDLEGSFRKKFLHST